MKITIAKMEGIGFSVLIFLLSIISLVGYLATDSMEKLAGITKDNTDKSIFISEKEVDHYEWVQALSLSLIQERKFTGELDHKKCGLGKWLYSNEIKNLSDPEIVSLLKEIETPHIQLHKSAETISGLSQIGDRTSAYKIYINETISSLNRTKIILANIKKYFDNKTSNAVNQTAKQAVGSKIIIFSTSVIAIILGILIAVLISKQIINILTRIINDIRVNATQVASASNQLASASQQLSEGSVEQACSIEETSSTLQESASMLQQNSANTKQAAQLSENTKEAAEKGNNEMQGMMSSIDDIKKSSDQIAKIIKVIDDIAFQTNILALNAAVEAARAGEAGMGFAVVAEEVRNLAQRSAQATKDTASIIEANIELSGNGVTVAARVKDALTEITIQAKKVNELMDEIAAASQEQSQGIEQVNKAIAQMETVTQQNSSNAEESASASEELSAQAQNLQEIVKQLSELVNGKAARELEETALHQVKHLNNNQPERAGLPERRSQSYQPKLEGSKTKVVLPEDVIPLEKDNKF